MLLISLNSQLKIPYFISCSKIIALLFSELNFIPEARKNIPSGVRYSNSFALKPISPAMQITSIPLCFISFSFG